MLSFFMGKKKHKKQKTQHILELGFLSDFQQDKNMTNFHHL